ncbi:hypothetical protein RRG08_033528 [Elysia crispata]|uniref:Uncharacterized protein n=1 Tax=Elysia crispata TaxID=231223 RepID=A0AAE1CK01_9GAST|nr:hypothetical protein RRG08_033528 [Elysia crispata]
MSINISDILPLMEPSNDSVLRIGDNSGEPAGDFVANLKPFPS